MRNKRDYNDAVRLYRRFGNVPPLTVLKRLKRKRKLGRPTKWTEQELAVVERGVDAFRARGLRVTAACRD